MVLTQDGRDGFELLCLSCKQQLTIAWLLVRLVITVSMQSGQCSTLSTLLSICVCMYLVKEEKIRRYSTAALIIYTKLGSSVPCWLWIVKIMGQTSKSSWHMHQDSSRTAVLVLELVEHALGIVFFPRIRLFRWMQRCSYKERPIIIILVNLGLLH
jgi:hypothetical protein